MVYCNNQEHQNSSKYDAENDSTAIITLNFVYDAAAKSNPSEVQNLTARTSVIKVCIWKKDRQSKQLGLVLQCHKTGISQDQEKNYTCTIRNRSMCRNACDTTNDCGGLRSFFLMIITKISFDTIHECVTGSDAETAKRAQFS